MNTSADIPELDHPEHKAQLGASATEVKAFL